MHSISNAGLLYQDAEEAGAFLKASVARVTPYGATVSGNHLGFDSSRSDVHFGSSLTVQPSSLQSLACIKV